jgi:hypothetical protein
MSQAPALRDTSESSIVAKLVTLHHRRHGWAWVAVASLIGLAVYAGIDVNLFRHLTGAAATLSVVPVFALLALFLVGLVDVIVDTSRLHRADAAVRASAKSSVSHYPWYAHAHSWPPRHPGSWVACLFLLVAMTSITAYILPAEVNAWAYVVGAENQDTFNPVSYSQACGGVTTRTMHCNTVTVGYLTDSGADVTWDSQVPLHQPFSARDPLWAWGTGRGLIDDDGSAIGTIAGGLFFDAVALLLLYVVVVVMLGSTSPRRSQPASAAAAADAGGPASAHHPNRGHHSDGSRRSSHHGRRKR